MAKKIADETVNTSMDKLIGSITRDIQKDFAISNFEENSTLTYLSTGNPGINYAISGKFDGGFPEGKITELYGLNSCVGENTIIEVEEQL